MQHTEKKIEDLTIFKKFLGPEFEVREDFSIIIGNHTSWMEGFLYFKKYANSWIAKADAGQYPLIGNIMTSVDTIYVERTDPEQAHKVVFIFLKNSRLYK